MLKSLLRLWTKARQYLQSDPLLPPSVFPGRPAAGWSVGWMPPPQPENAGCEHTVQTPSARKPWCLSPAPGTDQAVQIWMSDTMEMKKHAQSFTDHISYGTYVLKTYLSVYLWMWKMRASPPRVVNLSLNRSPWGVRSLRDKLPKLPCNAESPSAHIEKIMFTKKLSRKSINEKSRWLIGD